MCKFEKKIPILLRVWWKVCTFALAFGKTAAPWPRGFEELQPRDGGGSDIWKDLHKTENVVVQEAAGMVTCRQGREYETPSVLLLSLNYFFLNRREILQTDNLSCDPCLDCQAIIEKLYNGEFDPGSGWTLATGLTHASRGVTSGKLASHVDDRRTGE